MFYSYILWSIAFMLSFVVSSTATLAHSMDDKPSRRQRFVTIETEFDKGLAKFVEASNSAETDAENLVAEKLRPSVAEFGQRFLVLAEEQPADDVACDALLWIADKYAKRERPKLDRALDLIEQHHLGTPKLKSVVDALIYADSERANALAETIAEKAGDREVRGFACYCVGYGIYCRTGGARDAKSLADVERWMTLTQKEYADVLWEKRKLGDMAEAQMYEIRNLTPGKVAPEIEGVSVDGKKIKLSESRGKIVALVFWGSWCGPCMGEVPHLRELMATHFRRPFTVVGINSGDTKDRAEKVMLDEQMTWPMFFDGEDGPIVRSWNVTGFPMIYVIDAEGIIRCKVAPDDGDLDGFIARLVSETELKR